ncbi:MAG: glycosyltransferase family 2 protein [Actinobacteria bacterium]|nr:glycosyltransferase family 2 protein [Actinomycetota bacterium]
MATIVLSCVIVAFHRPASLDSLLRGLAGDGIEMIVVNVDDDPAVRDVAAGAGAVAVPLVGNPGYAAAVNAGVERASCAVVAFMNDDLRVSIDDLTHLAGLVATRAADVVVPTVVDASGSPEFTISALPTPANLAKEWLALPDAPVSFLGRFVTVEKWRRPDARERIQAAAASLVVTRRDLLMQRPLPEHYFLYWEESDWFFGLAQDDATVMYVPEATCQHVGGRADVRPDKSRLLARNAVRCVRRTQGRWAALVAWPIVVAWNARLLVTSLRRPNLLRARVAGLAAAMTAFGEVLR